MHCFVPVPMSMWSMDGLLVACVMDRDGIWVAVCVGCVWGSVCVCVWVCGCGCVGVFVGEWVGVGVGV